MSVTRDIRRREVLTLPALQKNFGDHKFKNNREVKTVVTRRMITQGMNVCQQTA
jgi:hypothetical protein